MRATMSGPVEANAVKSNATSRDTACGQIAVVGRSATSAIPIAAGIASARTARGHVRAATRNAQRVTTPRSTRWR
jgi:hypothetical protein